MSIASKILNFGNSRKGKIISWSLVGFSVMIFFIGLLMNVVPKMNTGKFNSIDFIGESLVYRQTYTGISRTGQPVPYLDAYYLTISKKQTFIQTVANPVGAKTQITFQTNSPFIGFEKSSIRAGDTAIINLKIVDGKYGFSNPNPSIGVEDIKITVLADGKNIATIYVRIVLNDEDFELISELEVSSWENFGVWVGGVKGVETKFFVPNGTYYGKAKYRIRIKFKIWGELFFDSARDGYDNFSYKELFTIYGRNSQPDYNTTPNHDINTLLLFGHELGNEITIGNGVQADLVENISIYYNIACAFDEKLFTKNNFKVNIFA